MIVARSCTRAAVPRGSSGCLSGRRRAPLTAGLARCSPDQAAGRIRTNLKPFSLPRCYAVMARGCEGQSLNPDHGARHGECDVFGQQGRIFG